MASVSLSRILAYWVERTPHATAVWHEGKAITFAELDASSNRLARAYADLGVSQDDFVTIALPNGIEFFQAAFASWKLGATPQPVSAKLPDFEREQIVELGEPRLVVGVDSALSGGAEGGATVTLPTGFEPDPTLSDAPLEERTASAFKAMTSGGSTGRPKLIVSANQRRLGSAERVS